jgi:hypothetical protein
MIFCNLQSVRFRSNDCISRLQRLQNLVRFLPGPMAQAVTTSRRGAQDSGFHTAYTAPGTDSMLIGRGAALCGTIRDRAAWFGDGLKDFAKIVKQIRLSGVFLLEGKKDETNPGVLALTS